MIKIKMYNFAIVMERILIVSNQFNNLYKDANHGSFVLISFLQHSLGMFENVV